MTGTLLGIACHALPSHWQRPWIACRPHSVFAMPYVMASFVSHARCVPRLGSNVLIFKGSRCDLTGAVLTRPELTRFVLSRPGLSCADLTCPGPLICLLAVLRFLVLAVHSLGLRDGRICSHNGSWFGSVCACVTFTCTLHVQLHLCLHLPQLTVDLTVVEAPATCGTAATQQGFHFLGLHEGCIPSSR